MSRVVGVGGIFFKAKDAPALRDWYRKHLGMNIEEWGGMPFLWNRPDGPSTGGMTIWSIFEDSSTYFAPSQAPFMINLIVSDLDVVLAALRSEGCNVDDRVEDSAYGKFGWVMDPEGNRVELWQPPANPSGTSSSTG